MNPTTTHSSEVVGQLVLIETDPIRARVKHAIAGFLAGYSGTTLEAYRLDLRGWITWLDAAFLDPFAVERAHIELYARWSESEGKARSTIGTTPVDDLRVLQVLLPRTPHRTRPIRPCPSTEAGLRVLHARLGPQRTRRVPRPSRTLRRTRPRTRLSARVERATHLRSPRRRHRQPRRQPRTPHPVHPSQRQQDRHDPVVAANGTGARSLHRRAHRRGRSS